MVTENFFRSYRGKEKQFVAVVKLTGGPAAQSLALSPSDFTSDEGKNLSTWKHVDLLSLRAYHEGQGKLRGNKTWAGPGPNFRKLRWQATGR